MKINLISSNTRLSFFIVLFLFAVPAFSQDEPVETPESTETDDEVFEEENDGFEINIGRHHYHSHSHTDFRFSMLDIGISTYLADGSFNLPAELDDFDLLYGGSININWHLFRHRLPIAKKKLGFEYGLTLSWMQYKFANDFEILKDQTEFTTLPIEEDLQKNKLKTTFLKVPLMLTITPGKRKSFYVSGGVYGGVLIGSKQKIKFDDGDKRKIKDDFNLNKFRYGIEGRVGLGPVSFYAQYSLQNLFKDGQGPELTPINLGVTLLAW